MKQHSFLTALCLLFAAVPITGQTIKSSMEFAPSEHWVKPVEKPYREEICLNGTWAFAPVQLPAGFKEGETPAPALPGVNEVTFSKTPIRIPSPWNVNSFADKNGLGGDHRTYPSYPKEWESIKMGWLQKKFTVPASWKGKRIQIHFEAVAGKADIYVNGKAVGNNFDIFMPFDIDITDAVKFGQENTLNVGIQKSSLFDDRKSPLGRRTYQGGSFWGLHIAGLWLDVYLV
uniref:sugar-binding domain-containing protein n=1 Tax=Coprobacter fastidiosus TaxID=1099853 RepID=UPI00307F08EF